jgi:hypothetical protein
MTVVVIETGRDRVLDLMNCVVHIYTNAFNVLCAYISPRCSWSALLVCCLSWAVVASASSGMISEVYQASILAVDRLVD